MKYFTYLIGSGLGVLSFAAIASPTIDNMALDAPAVVGQTVNIVYHTTPDTGIVVNYATCLLDAPGDCHADSLLEKGEVFEDGNPPITVSIPNSVSNVERYFTYCLKMTEIRMPMNATETICRSEQILPASYIHSSFSYLNQTANFSLYEKQVNTNAPLFVTSNSAFLTLDDDDSAFVYGKGEEAMLPPYLWSIRQMYSMRDGFAVLRDNQTLVSWGKMFPGVITLSDVKAVYPGPYSLSIIKQNGTIETIGDVTRGAFMSEETKTEISQLLALGGRIIDIYHTSEAYLAIVVMPEGKQKLVAWGNPLFGANLPNNIKDTFFDIKQVVASQNAFTILTSEGIAYSWHNNEGNADVFTEIESVKATRFAFAAIKKDNSIISWGENGYGGYLPPSVNDFSRYHPVSRLCATDSAFLAIADGYEGVVAWGSSERGGDIPSSLQHDLNEMLFTPNIKCSSTEGAFALYDEQSIWVWGARMDGGEYPSSYPRSGALSVVGNNHAFLMLNTNGVYAWGDEASGGCIPNATSCISQNDAELNLMEAIPRLNLDELAIGSFDDYSEDEALVNGGFYLRDSSQALIWGNNVPDGDVSW